MLTIYGIKNCDTCRRAKKYLEEKNIEFFTPAGPANPAYREDPPSF